MSTELSSEILESTKVITQSIQKLLNDNQIEILSQLVLSLHTELFLQKKTNKIIYQPRNLCVAPYFFQRVTKNFLNKRDAIARNFDPVNDANFDTRNFKLLLSNLFENGMHHLLFVAVFEISMELTSIFEVYELSELNFPSYLLSSKEKKICNDQLHQRFQKLLDEFSEGDLLE